jgi:hypothetical protein
MSLPDGTRFRRHLLDRKLEPGDRTATTASSGTMKVSFPDMKYARFEGQDVDAEADLRVYDFFPSQERDHVTGAHHGQPAGDDKHGHPESAGRVEGRVRMGERLIEVKNGIGYRDHSFGSRPHAVARCMRWNAGTVGPAMSWSLMTGQAYDGSFRKIGWLIRDGRREKIRDFHNVNCTLGDGISVLGGWAVVDLENGERLRIELETVDGVVTSTHLNNGGPGSSQAGVEALSITRWNGHEGVADFNMIDNAHRGEMEVSHLIFANCEDGLSKRSFDASWLR